ncbi:MAG: 30S ribosomal protein S3 [Victivallaceae bacterium]|nr:30S ribosomal protein S3 [Victivallaceae bacterium]
MGQKVHPYILRIGINKNWRSLWYADSKDYANNIKEDYEIRKFIKKRYVHAAVSCINIERMGDQIKIKVASARPGIIIGRRGADIDRLKSELAKITKRDLAIDIIEIKNPAMDAQLVAQTVAFQLEKRVNFRRAVKRAIDQTMQAGIPGIKISVAGRLGGAEIARRETYHEGSLPLQTLRADVDFGFHEAVTTYGIIGVKVWIYKGEVIPKKNKAKANAKSSK